MKLIPGVILFALVVLNAQAQDVSGTWQARFVGEPHRLVREMTFELKVDGAQVTGVAHMSVWPGDAPISEGEIRGDRISFTVIGNRPWTRRSPAGETSGYPKLNFAGTIRDGRADLSLTWDNVMISGQDTDAATTWKVQAEKIAGLP